MSELTYPNLPDINEIPDSFKQLAKEKCVTNLLLSFLDFHIRDEDFQNLKKDNFQSVNLLQTISDLKHYGYQVNVPESADEYRGKVYPLIMEMHAKAGYWGVQIPVGGVEADENGMLTENGKNLLRQQKEILDAAGLHASAVGGLWVADWTQCVKFHIQAANALGSKYLYGPLSTPFLYFPEGASSGEASMDWIDQRIEEFSQTLKNEIGPFAAKYDVTLCEEPLQRFERMPLRLKEAVQLALKADIDQFKIMVDMCHEFADGEGPAKYREYITTLHNAGKLHGIHISAVHRGKLYESWFNQQYFNDFFAPFIEFGYKGEISIETFDAMEPVVEAAKINRRMFKNPIGVMINQLRYSVDKLSKIPVKA